MHFTPGCESQARARAVDTGVVVAPVRVVDEPDGDVAPEVPSGGSVTVEAASSPPHAPRTSADVSRRQASEDRRSRRGRANGAEIFTATSYCVLGPRWWSSFTRADSRAPAPPAPARLSRYSSKRRGPWPRQAKPPGDRCQMCVRMATTRRCPVPRTRSRPACECHTHERFRERASTFSSMRSGRTS